VWILDMVSAHLEIGPKNLLVTHEDVRIPNAERLLTAHLNAHNI
jgi:hypothetical protein